MLPSWRLVGISKKAFEKKPVARAWGFEAVEDGPRLFEEFVKECQGMIDDGECEERWLTPPAATTKLSRGSVVPRELWAAQVSSSVAGGRHTERASTQEAAATSIVRVVTAGGRQVEAMRKWWRDVQWRRLEGRVSELECRREARAVVPSQVVKGTVERGTRDSEISGKWVQGCRIGRGGAIVMVTEEFRKEVGLALELWGRGLAKSCMFWSVVESTQIANKRKEHKRTQNKPKIRKFVECVAILVKHEGFNSCTFTGVLLK